MVAVGPRTYMLSEDRQLGEFFHLHATASTFGFLRGAHRRVAADHFGIRTIRAPARSSASNNEVALRGIQLLRTHANTVSRGSRRTSWSARPVDGRAADNEAGVFDGWSPSPQDSRADGPAKLTPPLVGSCRAGLAHSAFFFTATYVDSALLRQLLTQRSSDWDIDSEAGLRSASRLVQSHFHQRVGAQSVDQVSGSRPVPRRRKSRPVLEWLMIVNVR